MADLDLYQRLELEVRKPKKPLLLDAFLPAPETLPSAVAPPPPPPPVDLAPEEAGLLSRIDRDEEPEPPPRPAPKKKKAAAKKREAPKSLQDEIAEFMNRDAGALAPEEDLASFLKTSLDPNSDPEPDSGDKK